MILKIQKVELHGNCSFRARVVSQTTTSPTSWFVSLTLARYGTLNYIKFSLTKVRT